MFLRLLLTALIAGLIGGIAVSALQAIKISRVSKVTKGGKKLSFRAIVVIGDENGKVGVGVAKADDVVNAFKKAKTDGRKNLIKLPLTKSLSIPHNGR